MKAGTAVAMRAIACLLLAGCTGMVAIKRGNLPVLAAPPPVNGAVSADHRPEVPPPVLTLMPAVVVTPPPSLPPSPTAAPAAVSGGGATGSVGPMAIGITADLTMPLMRSPNTAVPLATVSDPRGLTVVGSTVYFLDGAGGPPGPGGQTLCSVPAAGGTVSTVEAAPVVALAHSGAFLFYATATGIKRLDTITSATTVVAGGQTAIRALAADAVQVYFVAAGSSPGNGVFGRVPVGGGAVQTMATGLVEPTAVAIDGTNAYFAERGLAGSGTIKSVPLAGGAATILAESQPGPVSLAIDGTRAYFANKPTGESAPADLRSVLLAGGGTRLLIGAMNKSEPVIAVDGPHLYYLEGNATAAAVTEGSVRRIPVTGGDPVLMAHGLNHPIGLGLDATHVYFSMPGPAAALKRLAK